jgi:hypothetical protein
MFCLPVTQIHHNLIPNCTTKTASRHTLARPALRAQVFKKRPFFAKIPFS